MGVFCDLTEQEFGLLTVVAREPQPPGKRTQWRCRCTCGQERVVLAVNLVTGRQKSCGCQRAVFCSEHFTTHGKSYSRENAIWRGIKQRCLKPSNAAYRLYGGRGITICDRWRDSFQAFYDDMGLRPSAAHSIDRRDNDGPYEPSNCYWATRTEQNRNTRRNRKHLPTP